MEQAINFDTRQLSKLQTVLQKYREVAAKSWAQIIGKEVSEWRLALYQQFKKISPKPSKIISDAIGRAFRVKRQGNSITRAENGISATANEAARQAMGGNKVELFRVEVNDNGVFVKPVRFSGRAKANILKGGRSGRKFADSARRASQVDPEVASQVVDEARKSDPTLRVLNQRAVGVAIELGLRSRAAKGGTMAIQWLGSNFKRRDSSTVKKGPQVARSTKGIPLGIVEFEGEGDSLTGKLSGLVPGTAKQADAHGIIGHVIAARIADRHKYIADKMEKAKEEALRS